MRAAWWALLVALPLGLAAACDLNPQPLPPGDQPDAGKAGGNGAGSADAGAPYPPVADGGSGSSVPGTDADAGSADAGDAGDADAGDAGDGDARDAGDAESSDAGDGD